MIGASSYSLAMYGGKLQGPVHVFYYRSLYARENRHELQRKRKAVCAPRTILSMAERQFRAIAV